MGIAMLRVPGKTLASDLPVSGAAGDASVCARDIAALPSFGQG